jgi:Flp pilus assembly protein TadG
MSKNENLFTNNSLRELANRFLKDRQGAIAILAALTIIVATVGAGVAIDFVRASRQRLALNAAVDAAALAVAVSGKTDQAELEQLAIDYINANYNRLKYRGTELDLDVVVTETAVQITAHQQMPTTLMKIVHIDTMDLGSFAEVTRRSTNLEVALALDTTGSMQGQKIVDLRAAAKELVDIVVRDEQTPFYTKLALAPYSMAINVGNYAEQVRGSYTSGTCTTPGCFRYRFNNPYGTQKTYQISTCVTERTGANAYTDAAPTVKLLGRNYPSPGNPCLSNTILPLTSDKTLLHSRIDSLQASGSTGGHIGVAWGWYLVSPNFGYLWPSGSQPAAYGTDELVKVVVLMTDGEYNSSYCNGVISKDSTPGSGPTSDHINCNAANGHSFDQSQALCANMKASGVVVYTVGFDVVDDQRARDLVAQCATDPEHVYLPTTGTELKDAFRAIGMDIQKLWLSK